MTQKEINTAIETSIREFGRDATIEALNQMYHKGLITSAQALRALDIINQ